MKESPNEMRRARAQLVEQGRALLNKATAEKRSLTTAESDEFDRLEAEITASGKTIEALERQKAYELEMASPIPMPGTSTDDDRGRNPNGLRLLRPEERVADVVKATRRGGLEELSLDKFLFGVTTGRWDGAPLEQRAMVEGTLAEGGYTVPTPLSAEIIDAIRNQAVCIRAGARTVVMPSQTLGYARVTGDVGAAWKAELANVAAQDMAFDKVLLDAKVIAARVELSVELSEDSQGLTETVKRALAETFAAKLDYACLAGSGTAPEPRGIINTTGVQEIDLGTNGDQLDSFDPFSQAVEKIANYNGAANAVVYSPRTAGSIDRLKEAATNNPLTPPASFAALSKFSTNQIPNTLTHGSATNASLAIVGQFDQLLIGTRADFRVEVSREADGAWGQLGISIRCYARMDCAVLRPTLFTVVSGIIP
jgi:HK97 family phage major capsid protein